MHGRHRSAWVRTLAVDCGRLDGRGPDQRQPNRLSHARAWNASRLGESIRHASSRLAAVGAGDTVGHPPRTPPSSDSQRDPARLGTPSRRHDANRPQTPPPGSFTGIWLPTFFYAQLTSVVLYAFILTIDHMLQSRERMARQQMEAAQLGEQLQRAQLDALRRQIEPHFVFNSMNAIAGLVRDNRNTDAIEMIVGLSDFLRAAAADFNRPHVALEQELNYLRQYLAIQKTRFAERLQVSLDIPAELLSAQVPSLILQALVENAIKHGISHRVEGGAIQVVAASANGTLSLSVGNDGPWLPADYENRRTGIGISNLRTRLQLMYGTAFELTLRNREAGGVQASVSLPLAGT